MISAGIRASLGVREIFRQTGFLAFQKEITTDVFWFARNAVVKVIRDAGPPLPCSPTDPSMLVNRGLCRSSRIGHERYKSALPLSLSSDPSGVAISQRAEKLCFLRGDETSRHGHCLPIAFPLEDDSLRSSQVSCAPRVPMPISEGLTKPI